MSKELHPLVYDTQPVTQTGNNNLYVNVQKDGVFNLSYTTPQISVTAEALIAIQSFSKDYYHLIVTEQNILSSNSLTVASNQALTEGTVPEELFATHATLTEEAIEALKKMPAIICNKNTDYNGNTNPKQYAIFAYIKEIKKSGKEISLSFNPILPVEQHYLNEYAADFCINIDCALTDLNKPRWTIKRANVFDAFKKSHINMPLSLL